jgi:hypothetical protein
MVNKAPPAMMSSLVILGGVGFDEAFKVGNLDESGATNRMTLQLLFLEE